MATSRPSDERLSREERDKKGGAISRAEGHGVKRGDVILMGPPGSGKGTQARFLCEENGFRHLATGDLFREHLRNGTSLGKLAEQWTSKGAYVPDDVTIGMVRETLDAIPNGTRIVFDGFPRTLEQAKALDQLLRERGRRIDQVVVIDVPREEVVQRLGARTRTDDTPEVVRKRLEVYDAQTKPVIEHYRSAGSLQYVSGVGAMDEVRERLRESVS
ncbi:MAG: adenylate kinase [Chloroflexi bacterium]|nr:adenylate kinase [Chloroflexota bacterium]